MIAYKLVRKAKDGQYYPLFIDKARPYVIGEKRKAEYVPTKGFAPRRGFHCCYRTYAPHLKTELASGQKRVWVECWVEGVTCYNRPESQGGAWCLADELTVLREMRPLEVSQAIERAQNSGW